MMVSTIITQSIEVDDYNYNSPDRLMSINITHSRQDGEYNYNTVQTGW